jgi:hypothetical protein
MLRHHDFFALALYQPTTVADPGPSRARFGAVLHLSPSTGPFGHIADMALARGAVADFLCAALHLPPAEAARRASESDRPIELLSGVEYLELRERLAEWDPLRSKSPVDADWALFLDCPSSLNPFPDWG